MHPLMGCPVVLGAVLLVQWWIMAVGGAYLVTRSTSELARVKVDSATQSKP